MPAPGDLHGSERSHVRRVKRNTLTHVEEMAPQLWARYFSEQLLEEPIGSTWVRPDPLCQDVNPADSVCLLQRIGGRRNRMLLHNFIIFDELFWKEEIGVINPLSLSSTI